MPSCTVITMASRRSMSSLVFREMPLAVFCRAETSTRQRMLMYGVHLDRDALVLKIAGFTESVCCIRCMKDESKSCSSIQAQPLLQASPSL